MKRGNGKIIIMAGGTVRAVNVHPLVEQSGVS
jgi:copper homeostasis protein CutC